MTPRARQALYALARWLPGPIVEIGSWVGLSTTAIARGIRDSLQGKRFDTIDLKLTADMYRRVEDGMAFYHPDDPIPLWINSKSHCENEILPVIGKPVGSNEILRASLARLQLSNLATDYVGDFLHFPAYTCRWLFCDTLHNLHEIQVTAPYLQRFLSRDSILVCHDIGSHPELIKAVREAIPLGYGVSIESLYIAEGPT
jgi:hypothetical protein